MTPCSWLEVKILSIKGAGKGLGHHGVGAGCELEGRSQSEEPPVREKLREPKASHQKASSGVKSKSSDLCPRLFRDKMVFSS